MSSEVSTTAFVESNKENRTISQGNHVRKTNTYFKKYQNIELTTLIRIVVVVIIGFPGGTMIKNPLASVGDTRDPSSIPGSGRSLGEGNGNSLQYS